MEAEKPNICFKPYPGYEADVLEMLKHWEKTMNPDYHRAERLRAAFIPATHKLTVTFEPGDAIPDLGISAKAHRAIAKALEKDGLRAKNFHFDRGENRVR